MFIRSLKSLIGSNDRDKIRVAALKKREIASRQQKWSDFSTFQTQPPTLPGFQSLRKYHFGATEDREEGGPTRGLVSLIAL